MSKQATLAVFVAALVVQIAILIAIPARKAYSLATGKSVALKIQPVDPYNILSGYYMTLAYDISRLRNFPNAKDFAVGETCYAILERESDGSWKPVSLERTIPDNLPENRVALRGQITSWQIEYGIETFYIPEDKRSAIEEDFRNNRDKAFVDIKVDKSGNAALERLRIEGRVYENR